MIKKLVPDHIESIVPYPPGKPLEELEREFGITDSIKLASNENPLGASPKSLEALREALAKLNRYPDGSGYYLRQRLADKFSLPFDGIVLGNGSNEIIELLIRTFLFADDEVILPEPSFLVYELAAQTVGGKAMSIPLQGFVIDLEHMLDAVSPRTKLVFINNPNNPTGTILHKSEFEAFLDKLPEDVIVVVDEAYIEFVRDPDSAQGFDYLDRGGSHIVVLRTFSKAYGLAGLRIGYGVMEPRLADYLNRVRQPFNTSALAQIAALAALDDDAFFAKTLQTVWDGLEYLYQECESMGLRCLPTQTNFFLIEVPCDAKEVYQAMLRQGVIIRAMNAYGLNNYIRINVGLPEENRRFVTALKKVLNSR